MKLDKLWIEDFKNLKNYSMDFDKGSVVTVLVGWNGTGKSNLFEALVVIFRDLDLNRQTDFAYKLKYFCRDKHVEIDSDPKRPARERIRKYIIDTDGSKTEVKEPPLPSFVFGYYSGPSDRFKELFMEHQRRYYIAIRETKLTDHRKLKELKALRRLFYAEDKHSKYVLLSFFLSPDEKIKEFLQKYLRIVGLESVLFVMKEPSWDSRDGDPRFWYARGLVQKFLDRLFAISLAPMRLTHTVQTGIASNKRQEHFYLYVKDTKALEALAGDYESASDFFASLESTDLSEVIEDVHIKIKVRGHDGNLTFKELSEGEQQLLVVLGLLRFTRAKESLILLDEPDTHLNPHWGVKYINILKEIVDDKESADADGETETRHIVMSTHDPLVISTLGKEQVQILKRNDDDACYAENPEMDPKGLGFTGILMSDMFGFRSDLDPDTLADLDKKVELSGQEGSLSATDRKELERINQELDRVGLLETFSDPYYCEFVKAWSRNNALKRFKKPFLSKPEKIDQAALTDKILEEILAEENSK